MLNFLGGDVARHPLNELAPQSQGPGYTAAAGQSKDVIHMSRWHQKLRRDNAKFTKRQGRLKKREWARHFSFNRKKSMSERPARVLK